MRGNFLLLAATLFAACGGTSVPERATVSGKLDGAGVVATNAVAVVVNSGTPAVDVLISNVADGCNANAANLKSKQVLSLGVTSLNGAALAAGDFGVYDQNSGDIPQGTVVFADYHSTNAGCGDSTPPNTAGASGHVKVTKLSLTGGGDVQGTFDVILQNGDRLTGTFDAPVCGGKPDAGADGGCN